MCGGTAGNARRHCVFAGLSPRVRGNRYPAIPEGDRDGSIPACAGEPEEFGYGGSPAQVYPRVCGGTMVNQNAMGQPQGLSPRVRGNLGGDGQRQR